jgi:large subunit ribosomal protein L25
MGGIVDQQLREIDLECLPRAIPKELEVDVGALELGDSLHVRDIALPAGVTLRTDPDLSVVSVVAPSKAEEEPAEPTEEEAAEGEGVEGEEGAEAPAADAGGEPDKAAEKGD